MSKRRQPEPELTYRDQLVLSLTTLHAALRPLCLRAGLTEIQYDAPLKSVPDLTNEAIEELYAWFQSFHITAYESLAAIWRLKPPEWWHNMETLFSLRKTREQKLLKAESRKLRMAWSKRHGKGQPDPVEDNTQADPQPV